MVFYKYITLARNSEAYTIWLTKDFKKLDLHLKEVEAKYHALVNKK
jgi:hypothetical protein